MNTNSSNRWFIALAGIVMAPMMRTAMRKDLENLKIILEAS